MQYLASLLHVLARFKFVGFLYFVGLFRSYSWHYLLKAAGVGSYGDLRRAVQTQLQQKFRRAGDGGHSRGMLWSCFFLYVDVLW